MTFAKTFSLAAVLTLLAAPLAFADLSKLPLPGSGDTSTRNISVVVDRGLKRTKSLPSSLRQARIDLLDKKPVPVDKLKLLADRRETLAAARYAAHLAEGGIRAEIASDVAWYSAIAVGGGRVWMLDEMIDAMHFLDAKTEPKARINQYIRVLYPHAWAGNELALDAVIDFNGEGRLFGPLSQKTKARIEAQIEKLGSGRGDLKIAISLLSDPELTQDKIDRARVHLQRAAQSDHLAVSVTAANLIEQLAAKEKNSATATH